MYAKDIICINHPNKGFTSSLRCQQSVKQGYIFNPLLFGLYLDALEGRLKGRKCNTNLNRLACMAVVFYRWPCFNVGIKGGTPATVRHVLVVLCWKWVYAKCEKNKSHGIQFCWPMPRVCVRRWHYWTCVNVQIPRDLPRYHLKRR
jgi:hypothetical protein